MRVILASGSAARRAMCLAAGLKVAVLPADVDEAAFKAAATGTVEETALALAVAKAQRVSAVAPGALVVGADQMLVCEGRRYDKPNDMSAAAAQLRALRGRTHFLVTAVCVAQGGAVVWSHIETPVLTMREFSEEFLASYLTAEGEKICGCVGAYRLEGFGAQLFARVEGDYFTILGLPLLALLGFLRQAGEVPA
jgi:septum formation protein